jgi:hypothetical protein
MYEVSFIIPYLTELSKNKRYGYRGNKKLSYGYKNAKCYTSTMFKQALAGHPIPRKSKCYVQIMCYRPSMRDDPCNYIDGICDSLTPHLCFNDNYFSVNVDWELDRENPRMEISFKYSY